MITIRFAIIILVYKISFHKKLSMALQLNIHFTVQGMHNFVSTICWNISFIFMLNFSYNIFFG